MKKIKYNDLNARQKENYNFQKIASRLAEYGYSCMWLNDDWQGADFIANHVDGAEFLKVQLKSRPTISKKYIGKNIYIAFRSEVDVYLYPHDEFMEIILAQFAKLSYTSSWQKAGGYSWRTITSKTMQYILEKYKI